MVLDESLEHISVDDVGGIMYDVLKNELEDGLDGLGRVGIEPVLEVDVVDTAESVGDVAGVRYVQHVGRLFLLLDQNEVAGLQIVRTLVFANYYRLVRLLRFVLREQFVK